MSGFQGSISFNSKGGAPPGFINVAGANDGLSVSAGNFIQLGQPAGTGGAGPARLLDSREIPLGGNALNFGVPADIAAFALIQFYPRLTIFQDVQNTQHGFIVSPINNFVPAGAPNFNAGCAMVSQILTVTNPAASGFIGDFKSVSTWNTAISSDNFFSFQAFSNINTGGGSGDVISFHSAPNVQATGGTGNVRGFYHNPQTLNLATMGHVAIENVNGDNRFNSAAIGDPGRSGFRLGGVAPTAFIHLGAGTTTEAFLKLSSGAILAANQANVFEYDGSRLFFTFAAMDRWAVLMGQAAAAPGTTPAVALLNFHGISGSTYLGEPDDWILLKNGTSVLRVPGYL